MPQSLVVLHGQTNELLEFRTVLFGGTNADAVAVRNAVIEALGRTETITNVAPGDVNGIMGIDLDETDDDTIAPGDEVTPTSNIVIKAAEQRSVGQ